MTSRLYTRLLHTGAGVLAVAMLLATAPSLALASEGGVLWVKYLPGYHFLDEHYANHSHQPPMLDMGHISPDAIYLALIVFGILLVMGLVVSARQKRGGDEALLPAGRISLPMFAEDATNFVLNLLEDLVGPEKARMYLPLLGTLFVFILVSNIIGLIPGMGSPTSNLSLNAGMSLIVFLYYNALGFKEHGLGYLKHFAGPMIWLAPLMFAIEIIGHIVRPVTLSLRLAMNMTADHLVVGIFTDLTKMIIPVIFLVLGVLVCFIQALVFTLLTGVYIKLSTAHEH